jgi:hypothetical protein
MRLEKLHLDCASSAPSHHVDRNRDSHGGERGREREGGEGGGGREREREREAVLVP